MSDTTHPPEEPQPTPPPEPSPAPPAEPEGEPEGQPRDEAGRFTRPDDGRFEKRIGVIRAQLSQTARQRDELAARIAAIEQRIGGQGQPQVDPHLQAYVQQEAQSLAEKQRMEERIAAFHEQGAQRYPDWKQRCDELQGMGADFNFAQLLVKMPDGARVAGALRDDPDEVERIASMPPDARPFALGQYLAKLDAQPTRQVSKAPAPPKPLPGRSSPMPNPYLMEANDLAAMWMKEALEAQRRR